MSANADTETGSAGAMTDFAEAMLADRRRVAEDYNRAYQQLRKEATAKGIVPGRSQSEAISVTSRR